MEDRYNADPDVEETASADGEDSLVRALDCLPEPVVEERPASEAVAAPAPAVLVATPQPADVVAPSPVASAQQPEPPRDVRRVVPLQRSLYAKLLIWKHRATGRRLFSYLYPAGYVLALLAAYQFLPQGYVNLHGTTGQEFLWWVRWFAGAVALVCLVINCMCWQVRYQNYEQGFVEENIDIAAAIQNWIREYRNRSATHEAGTITDFFRRHENLERMEVLHAGIRFHLQLLTDGEQRQPAVLFLQEVKNKKRMQKLRNKSPLYESEE